MKHLLSIEQIDRIPVFFIVGRPRTGSTLLRTMFDAHPNVIIPPEWPMLLLLYRRFNHVKVWNKETLQEFYEALFQPLRIKYWSIRNWPEIDFVQLHAQLMQCQGAYSLETLFKVVYCSYNSFFDKDEPLIIGDKNPAVSIHTALLSMLFPSAKFIHLVRDYRDNISSLLNVDFEMPNIPLLAYRWRYLYTGIDKVAKKYPRRFYTIRYEDFVDNPTLYFNKLCNFLQIPENSDIVNFYQRKLEIENSYPPEVVKLYFSSLMQPVDKGKVGIYKQKLSKRQIQEADMVVGKIGDMAGYRRDFTKFSIWDHVKVWPAIFYTKGLYWLGKGVEMLPYPLMIWLINKPSFVVKMYTRVKGISRK